MSISIKYSWGVWEDLTWSSTIVKSDAFKDEFSLVVDYWMHQWAENANELNNLTDEEAINADFIVITHAHMDHVGRLPLLVKKWLKWRIIMTKETYEISKLMLNDYVKLTKAQIKFSEDATKRLKTKLSNYLQIINIDTKLSENNLKQADKSKLENSRIKILDWRKITDFIRDSIEYIKWADEDFDIDRILPRKKASELLDIQESIDYILDSRQEKSDTHKKEFDKYLLDLIKLNNDLAEFKDDSSKLKDDELLKHNELLKNIEKNKYLLSLYPNGINSKLDEIKWLSDELSSNETVILKSIIKDYEWTSVSSKNSDQRKENKELSGLEEKRNKIIWDKNLDLCLIYSKKILWRDSEFDIPNNNKLTLLYDTNDIDKTMSMVEILKVWDELNLDDRIVMTTANIELIDRLPSIVREWYNKKIYIDKSLEEVIITRLIKNYSDAVVKNQKNKILIDEYEKATKFINRYNKSNNKNNLDIPNSKNVETYYHEQLVILENSDVSKFKESIEILFSYKEMLDSSSKFNDVENSTIYEFEKKLEEVNTKLSDIRGIYYWEYSIFELWEFYLKNKKLIKDLNYYNEIQDFIDIEQINSKEEFIKKWNASKKITKWAKSKNIHKINLEVIYNNYLFNKNNSEKIELLLNDDKKILDSITSNIEFTNGLEVKKRKINVNKNLFWEYHEFKAKESFYLNEVKKLDNYNFDNGIEWIIKEKFSSIHIPFTKEELNDVIEKLEITHIDEKKKQLESIKMRFHDAWHIEWSVQVEINFISKTIKNQIDHIIYDELKSKYLWTRKVSREYKNILLTWDLWKFEEENISGKPSIPSDRRFDYVQFESTYATKNHKNKKEELNKLIAYINSWKEKVLIPAFSLQRTQEVIIDLLHSKIDNATLLKQYWKKKKAYKLFLKNNKKLLNTESKLLDESNLGLQNKLFDEKSSFEKMFFDVEQQVFVWEIIVDSPLWEEISKLFIWFNKEKYWLLHPDEQIKAFWKVMVKFLWQWDYKFLYDEENIHKKHVIVSSSWMMQWWRVMSHLKEILENWSKKSKIWITWYQAERTTWWNLVRWIRQIKVDWETYNVENQVEPFWGFSSHIWKDDIIKYVSSDLKLSKWATLASVHWTGERKKLVEDIKKQVWSDIKFLIPERWDTVTIEL